MLRLDTFIVAEFVSMLNFFYEKCWDTGLVTPTFIIEPFLKYQLTRSLDYDIISKSIVKKMYSVPFAMQWGERKNNGYRRRN